MCRGEAQIACPPFLDVLIEAHNDMRQILLIPCLPLCVSASSEEFSVFVFCIFLFFPCFDHLHGSLKGCNSVRLCNLFIFIVLRKVIHHVFYIFFGLCASYKICLISLA